MAVPPEIKVRITGDTSGLEKASRKVKDEVDDIKKSAEKGAGGVDELSESLDDNAKSADKATDAHKDLDKEFNKEAISAGAVLAVFTAGIALLSQLEEDTGLLARAFTGLSKEQRLSADAQEKLSLEISKSLGAVQAEVFQLKTLVGIARDETKTREERENAIRNINAQYPDLLKNLSLETIATNDVDRAVQSLTNSLIRQAKVKAISDRLSTLYGDLNKVLATTGEEAATVADHILAGFQVIAQGSAGAAVGLKSFAERLKEAGNLTLANQFFEIEKNISATEKQLKELLKEENFQITIPPPKLKPGKGIKPTKFGANIIDIRGLEDIGVQAGETLQKALSGQQNRVREGLGDLLEKPLADSLRKSTPHLEAISNKFDLAKESGLAFASAVGQGFSQLGSLISNTLETGIGIVDVFISTIVSGIAQLVASFAQKAILDKLFAASSLGANLTASNANAITIATSAAAGLGPLGFAAFPGLLAATLTQVNAAFAAIPKLAQGGIVGGGSFTGDQILARLNSGERILTIQDQGILTRVLQGHLRSVNGTNTPISVEGIIRGNDILIANNRADRKNRRFGR